MNVAGPARLAAEYPRWGLGFSLPPTRVGGGTGFSKVRKQGPNRPLVVPWGQCNLGFMYANGQGVKQGHAEAVRWYRKAAEQGQVNAVVALKQLSTGAVTSNASPLPPKAKAPNSNSN